MRQIPDSPEGVAAFLLALILGITDPMPPPQNEEEVLRIYRKCLEATRDTEPTRQIEIMKALTRQH
jgi:hypothetical protein